MVRHCVYAIFLISFFSVVGASTQELTLQDKEEQLVRVDSEIDMAAPYKERRTTHGALFSINMEDFYPIDYRSLYNDAHIDEIVGEEKLKLFVMEIGYKYNVGFASAAALFTYGKGSLLGAAPGGNERRLSVTKIGATVNLAIDGVFSEPWVVPYVQGGAHQFQVTEENTDAGTGETSSLAATTAVSMNYRYGLLFQLDWIDKAIDKSSKADRLISSGMENVYLDVYFSEHLASGNAIDPGSDFGTEGDPNMLSSGELGVGLKLEF